MTGRDRRRRRRRRARRARQHGLARNRFRHRGAAQALASVARARRRRSSRASAARSIRSPFAPAVVLPRPEPGACVLPRRARASTIPGIKVTGQSRAELSAGRRSAASSSACSARSASRSSARSGTRTRRAGEIVGQSGVEATYDSLLNAGLRAGARARRLARAASPARCACRAASAADAAADDRRAPPAGGREGRAGRDRARRTRNGHATPTGGSAVVIDPRTGAIYALASYADFNQVRAANDPAYLARLLHANPSNPLFNRAIAGPLSDGLDVQADRRRGGARAGIISPYTPLLCTRLVRPRRHRLPQRRGGRVLDDDAADRARRVVRHVVLPARRPDLRPEPARRTGRSIQQWARQARARQPHRTST